MKAHKQIKAEMRQLAERLAPITSEYFDGFLLVGIRAGTPHLQLNLMQGNKKKVRDAAVAAVVAMIREES